MEKDKVIAWDEIEVHPGGPALAAGPHCFEQIGGNMKLNKNNINKKKTSKKHKTKTQKKKKKKKKTQKQKKKKNLKLSKNR